MNKITEWLTKNKSCVLVCIGVIVFFSLLRHALADERCISPTMNTTINNGINKIDSSVVLPMAMAQHNFDFGTYSLQGSLAAAAYGHNAAISYAMGKRIKDGPLVNVSVSGTTENLAVGGAINWRF